MTNPPAPLTPRQFQYPQFLPAASRTETYPPWTRLKAIPIRVPLVVVSVLFSLAHSFPARADNRLTGTIIGTSGSFNNSGNTKEKAMDGNTSTFFDGPTPNNDWVGLDMTGQLPKQVTTVRYFPRASFPGRMLNGIFQGSNTNDFSVAVNLYTITSTPPAGVFTTQTISVTNAFSYVRYLAPTNGSGNVSELEFYGVDIANPGAPSTPTNLTAVAGDRQVGLT